MTALIDRSSALLNSVKYLFGARLSARKAPACVNFCVHTEMLYDEEIFTSLIRFAGDVYAMTGARLTACVRTPLCLAVRKALEERGVKDEEFADRLRRLSNVADIGYHGHFYTETGGRLVESPRISRDDPSFVAQITSEMHWFRTIGIEPRVYSAGWWFLTEGIVQALERAGITVDLSIRMGMTDSFGGRYLDDDRIPPPGEPFILPPSRSVVEIQSLFGPVMPTHRMLSRLGPLFGRDPSRELFFVFPLHDWDIPRHRRAIGKNVAWLTRAKGVVQWRGIMSMAEAYLKDRGSVRQ